ncbi:hypothetical protein T07_5125 [Trichinella nelsoni]|uniref:Uncharacterized protein n=1 Tax=Trichinella nelsoni TaxID=6336 RepID=A0A0V0RF01_9BILA|nr:hypothetical protein T07_5125 [Trichinella nelsoni]
MAYRRIEDKSGHPEDKGDRCAANEQWRFQCDDGRRIAIKTALNRRKEDGRERPEDEGKLGVRRVTLHDATLTVSNDQSPYFQSSPLPLPVADLKQSLFISTAPAPPSALLPVNGDFPWRSLLVPCCPEIGFKEMTLSICVRQLCKFAIDVVPRLCSNLVVIVTPPRGTVSVARGLCYCLAGSDTWPMIDIRFAVWL